MNPIIGFVGRRGSGKSYQSSHNIKRCQRIFLWDPLGEHTWCPNTLTSVRQVPAFFRWARQHSADQYAARLVVSGEMVAEFNALCELVYAQGDLCFGVEEVPLLVSPSSAPWQFDKVIRLGRHQNVAVVWTAQRMAEVARRLTAATDQFVLFGQTEPRDLVALEERCGADVLRAVMDLPKYHYVVFDAVNRKLSNATKGYTNFQLVVNRTKTLRNQKVVSYSTDERNDGGKPPVEPVPNES